VIIVDIVPRAVLLLTLHTRIAAQRQQAAYQANAVLFIIVDHIHRRSPLIKRQ